jgi:OOP family OmpA-OmpF porin
MSNVQANQYVYKEEHSMKKRVLFLTLSLLLATVVAGHAEVKAGAFSLTPFVGGYTFEGNENLKNTSLVAGLRGGYNFTQNWGFEGFFNYVPTESTSLAGNPSVNLYGFGIEGLYHFMPNNRLVPFLAVGVGGTRYDIPDADRHRDRFTADYGAGLKYFLTENFALRADVRHVILPLHDRYNELLYTFGLHFSFGGEKRAMASARAQEPAAAAEIEVAKDSDRDGVPDNLDKCPGTPAGVDVDKVGCPLDSDKDGVPDYLDKCPGTPTGVKVDKIGCPLDSDKDGVPDYLDSCPGTPAGEKVDRFGCPPMEQLQEVRAQAPAAAAKVETKEVKAAAAVAKEMFEKGRATINVEFDLNKANIKPAFDKELQKFADVMKNYPDLKVIIEGHTDNLGGKDMNEKLSAKRANSVKNYLTQKFGIAESRLTAKGYGMSKPIVSNKTKAGRQKNRRVEAAVDYLVKK